MFTLTSSSLGLVACIGEYGGSPAGPDGRDRPTVIEPGGSTVTHPSGVVISAPPGAVTASVTVTVMVVSSHASVADPDLVGAIYVLGPAGATFDVPVQVRLPWPPRFDGNAADLLAFTVDEAGYPEVLDEIHVVSGSLVAGRTTHFSPFWVSASGPTATELVLEQGKGGRP